MISIIIPHSNSRHRLEILLSSLEKQQFTENFEVLVVSNPPGKHKKISTKLYKFPLHWLESPKGANHARKKGADFAKGEILLFLDDDCEVRDPNFLSKHFKYHQDPQLAGVGGRYAISEKNNLWGRAYHYIQNQWLNSYRIPYSYNIHLLGGNASYKSEVLRAHSFDTKIIFGGTETELQLRLYQNNLKLCLFEDLEVYHHGDLPLPEFLRKSFKQGVGAAYISSRHQRPSQFVFNEENKSPGFCLTFAHWIYSRAFHAGYLYFQETLNLQCPNSVIYYRILKKVCSYSEFKKTTFARDMRALGLIIQSETLTSEHNNDQDSD